jgi:hypothetical protein
MTDTDIYFMFKKSGNSNISIENMSSTHQGEYHTTQTPNSELEHTQIGHVCASSVQYIPTTDNCAAALAAICRLSTGKARVRSQVSPTELSVDKVALLQVFLPVQ